MRPNLFSYCSLFLHLSSYHDPFPSGGSSVIPCRRAIFGLTIGTLMVSFASSIGATLAMLAARFLLRDWVQQRFETYLKTINEGMLNEGGFYLFTLRLVPVIPFL